MSHKFFQFAEAVVCDGVCLPFEEIEDDFDVVIYFSSAEHVVDDLHEELGVNGFVLCN